MKIAIPLYDRFTALDAVGPYEVLPRLPGAEITWLGARARARSAPTPASSHLHADAAFEELPDPDIMVVPGGTGTRRAARRRAPGRLDPARPRDVAVDDLGLHRLAAARRRRRARRPRGDQPLARPRRRSSSYGARPTGSRVVEQGKVITAAGVSSGIDMALTLVARIAGPEVAQAIQLGIEYDPQPPFDAGSVDKAPPEIVELVRSVAAART